MNWTFSQDKNYQQIEIIFPPFRIVNIRKLLGIRRNFAYKGMTHLKCLYNEVKSSFIVVFSTICFETFYSEPELCTLKN